MDKSLRLDVIGVLESVIDYLDRYIDVEDGDYGEPRPNRAMSLSTEVESLLETLNRANPWE